MKLPLIDNNKALLGTGCVINSTIGSVQTSICCIKRVVSIFRPTLCTCWCVKLLECRSSDEDSKRGDTKRQLVELEREIDLTTPLIAELDSRLTGPSAATKQIPSPTVVSAETASSAELSVKTTEAGSTSDVTVEKLTTAVDSGLQMESSVGGSRSYQVCRKIALTGCPQTWKTWNTQGFL